MKVRRTKGLVIVLYQDDTELEGTSTVAVQEAGPGEGYEVRIRHAYGKEVSFPLSYHDALALAAALTAAEVPEPAPAVKTRSAVRRA